MTVITIVTKNYTSIALITMLKVFTATLTAQSTVITMKIFLSDTILIKDTAFLTEIGSKN